MFVQSCDRPFVPYVVGALMINVLILTSVFIILFFGDVEVVVFFVDAIVC